MFGAVSGALALVAVAWIGVISFSALDPPTLLRIVGSTLLPIGIGGAIGAWLAGRHGPGRQLLLLGMALAAAAVLALVVMVVLAY
jgi:hypothetical protein